MKKEQKREPKKRQKKKYKTIILLLIIIIAFLLIYLIPYKTGRVIEKQRQDVQFYFYDELTNCPLNGYVFIGNLAIGKTTNGIFDLTYENYLANFNKNQNISIFGILGSCFNQNSKNQNLFFDKYFMTPKIKEYHFLGDSLFNFKTQINANNPSNRELQGFIQPDNVNSELNSIDLEQNILADLTKINNYLNSKIKYVIDWDFNKQVNYWQTPSESLDIQTGDCEDFSTTLLSLFSAYDSSLNCFNIIFTSHVTTLCHIEDNYIYYDQGRTELKTKITNNQLPREVRSKLRELNQDYFEYYGLNNSNTKAHYAFNNNEFIKFNNDQEFIDWQYNLENINPNINIFQRIELEIIENTRDLPKINLQGELRTQTISLSNSKNTSTLIISIITIILIIFLVIMVILDKRNTKHIEMKQTIRNTR